MHSTSRGGAVMAMAAGAIAAIGLAAAPRASADDLGASCQAPGWDMGSEISTFKSTAENVPAGGSVASLPPLEIGVLYVLKLRPQNEVSYLQISNKKSLVQAPLGGLTSFTVVGAAAYRITVDSPLWIDLVGPDGTIAPSAYTGWHDCRLFRKSVEYTLQAGQSYVLQLSEATPQLVRVVIEVAKH